MTNYFERLSQQERSRSSAAVWCQRLAVFAIPYLLIVILGHRFGAIDTISAFWLLGLGIALLIAALIAGIRGFYELWSFGSEAGLSSARGMALALVMLLPFLYQGILAFSLPQLYDISTDLEDPPAFDSVLEDRTDQMNPVLDPTNVTRRLQLEAYPRVSARRYPLDTARVFKEVVELVGDRDWTILTTNTEQGQAPIDDEGSGLVSKPVTDSRGLPIRIPTPRFRPRQIQPSAPVAGQAAGVPAFETQQVSPIGRTSEAEAEDQEERYVEAVASTFIFGFESDIVVRLIEEEDGTLVDMRSTSRWGPHDLGSNSARIIAFMTDLDASLQGLSQ